MKTAEDYIQEYSITKDTDSKFYEIRKGGQKLRILSDLISSENLKEILTEHDNEIKQLIDKEIKRYDKEFEKDEIYALTELKNKL